MRIFDPIERDGTAVPIERTSKARKRTFLRLLGLFLAFCVLTALVPPEGEPGLATSIGQLVKSLANLAAIGCLIAMAVNRVMAWWERG